jgi:hypothetical protein
MSYVARMRIMHNFFYVRAKHTTDFLSISINIVGKCKQNVTVTVIVTLCGNFDFDFIEFVF